MAQDSNESKANVSARMAPGDRSMLEAVAEYNGVSLSSLANDVLTDFARSFVADVGADVIIARNEERAAERAKAALHAAQQRQRRFSHAAALVNKTAVGQTDHAVDTDD